MEEFEMKNIDFVYRDAISQSYLSASTNLIAVKVGDEEIERLKENNILLHMTISPGNVISNFVNYPNNGKPIFNHMVSIDKNVIEYCNFSPEEKAGAIMHEFGHIMNVPDDITFKEFYADYYAKSKGFGGSLASSLEKYLKANLPYITGEIIAEIQKRIEALNDANQTPLEGRIKTLNKIE